MWAVCECLWFYGTSFTAQRCLGALLFYGWESECSSLAPEGSGTIPRDRHVRVCFWQGVQGTKHCKEFSPDLVRTDSTWGWWSALLLSQPPREDISRDSTFVTPWWQQQTWVWSTGTVDLFSPLSGLRVILQAQKTMSAKGGMKVIHVNEIVREVFEVTGFTDILTIE